MSELTTNTFTHLREANRARQVEWDKDAVISAAYRGNELAGEVGEACNIIKKLERARLGIAGSRADLADLAHELADVLICVDLIAMHYDIDMEVAVTRKFNATSEKVGLATRLDLMSADERCIACERVMVDGDPYYPDASGGVLHAGCCGPERECYTGPEGEPLGPNDPIPEPAVWSIDGLDPGALSREQFLGFMAARFVNRVGMTAEQAADYARTVLDGFLETEQVEFGGKPNELSWSVSGAQAIADEEISCWEA